MIQLMQCAHCKGFLALALKACPHCEAPVDRVRQAALGLAAVLGGGAVSMTLMACYGSACVDGSCSDPYPSDDAGDVDAAADSGSDAATLDAAPDSATDAGVDSATDAGTDAARDGSADASVDAPANG
ncbi:MAG: hypothetical protein U0169_25240 [Polyangiaceae bacterium]